jgi:hypothetical protein
VIRAGLACLVLCFSATAASAALPDPCALLDHDTAERFAGEPLSPAIGSMSEHQARCRYEPTGNFYRDAGIVELRVHDGWRPILLGNERPRTADPLAEKQRCTRRIGLEICLSLGRPMTEQDETMLQQIAGQISE